MILTLVGTSEFLSWVYVSTRDGRWISVAERLQGIENLYVAAFNADAKCRYLDSLFPHPYLGFVFHNNPPCRSSAEIVSGGIKAANRQGFLDERDFPLTRSSEFFDILLLGGSVASQIGQVYKDGPLFLEDALNRCYKPSKGARFRVFNGGQGAWKQPQEAFTFLMYGSGFSGVVSLEGFNEHYMLVDPSVRLEMPANNFQDVNPFAARSYDSVVSGYIVNRLKSWAQRNWLASHSFAIFMAIRSISDALQPAIGNASQLTTVRSLFEFTELSSEARRNFNMQQYLSYLQSMDAHAQRNGVYAAIFIQPAPAIDRPLTAEEKIAVGDLSYRDVYRWMAQSILDFGAKRHTATYSLLSIYKDVDDRVYADPIHADNHGESVPAYRLMAWHMAHRLADAWGFANSNRCKNDLESIGLPAGYARAVAELGNELSPIERN